MIEEFLQSKRGGGTAEITIDGYFSKFKVFARKFGDKFIHELEPIDVEQWFNERQVTGESRKGYRCRVSIL